MRGERGEGVPSQPAYKAMDKTTPPKPRNEVNVVTGSDPEAASELGSYALVASILDTIFDLLQHPEVGHRIKAAETGGGR